MTALTMLCSLNKQVHPLPPNTWTHPAIHFHLQLWKTKSFSVWSRVNRQSRNFPQYSWYIAWSLVLQLLLYNTACNPSTWQTNSTDGFMKLHLLFFSQRPCCFGLGRFLQGCGHVHHHHQNLKVCGIPCKMASINVWNIAEVETTPTSNLLY